MTKLKALIIVFMLLCAVSCRTKEEKEESAELDSIMTGSMDSEDYLDDDVALADPDPLDTIPGAAYNLNTYGIESVEKVRKMLREKYKNEIEKGMLDSASKVFRIYEYDLNGDGKDEILVALSGRYFCGSGGCKVMLFGHNGEVVTTFTVAKTPIIISDVATKGWHDLFMVSGGKYHVMRFNGKSYPSNPSTAPVPEVTPDGVQPRAFDYENEPYPRFSF